MNDSFFLDSGAFSAWSRKEPIDIYDYINYIKNNKDYIDLYSVLDDICDPEITLNNQKIMEKEGLNPIPCFHYGEDTKYLEHYVNNYDYVSLGGMVPISSRNLVLWLDNLFSNFICNENGYPKIKIHGFGMTTPSLLFRYPWYSVDSTSWMIAAAYGEIMIPKIRNNKYVYDINYIPVFVSSQIENTTKRINKIKKHINTFSERKRKILLDYIHEKGFKLGKSKFKDDKEIVIEKGLSNDVQERCHFNLLYYLEIEKQIPKWPWKFKMKSIKGLGL